MSGDRHHSFSGPTRVHGHGLVTAALTLGYTGLAMMAGILVADTHPFVVLGHVYLALVLFFGTAGCLIATLITVIYPQRRRSKQATPPRLVACQRRRSCGQPGGTGSFLLRPLIAIAVWFVLPAVHSPPQTTLSYSRFLSEVSAGKVKTVDIAPSAGSESSGTLKDGTNYTVVIPAQAGQSMLTDLADNNVQVTASSSSTGFGSQLFSWLILAAVFLLPLWFWFRLSRGAVGGALRGVFSAGRSRAKVFDQERPSTTDRPSW